MNNEWSLRAEIFDFTHRWPLPFLLFLLGSLLGFGFSKYFPTPYRAETSLSVTFSDDLIVRNPDDFKNAQMGELNLFIVSREVTSETLDRLRKRDPYWNQVSVRGIEARLKTYWRNTGVWRLVAEDPDPQRALELAQAWGAVATGKVQVALFHADHLMALQTQYGQISQERVAVAQRLTELDQIDDVLESFQDTAGRSEEDSPLDALERMRLENLTARLVKFDPSGLQLLSGMPPVDSPPHAYAPWVDRVLGYLKVERALQQQQQIAILTRSDETYQNLSEAIKRSQGLTAYIQVEELPSDKQMVTPVRKRTDMAVIGGFLGLIAWLLVWLGWASLKARK